jgi:hypothetical protein
LLAFLAPLLRYDIRATQLPRTGQSATAFLAGLFDGRGSLARRRYQPAYVYTVPTDQDTLLRGYETCPAYVRYVEEVTKPVGEKESGVYADRFIQEVLDRVSKKSSGGQRKWSRSEVETAYKLCGFELSNMNKSDGFCSIFSPEDILIVSFPF